MNEPMYKIGDKFKRSDYYDPKTYTIDKIKEWRGAWIYHAIGQGFTQGWAWIGEYHMKPVVKMAYQDQLIATGARQIEFVASKQTEPKIIGKPKHKTPAVLKHEGLENWGISKPGQRTL